mmetsp:Transcript_5249/g.6860  ORF Transcript_5249/g.6860 Transcript_5249/m.6860 type:complete len:143 (+) Transcript_5249:210-638(+)
MNVTRRKQGLEDFENTPNKVLLILFGFIPANIPMARKLEDSTSSKHTTDMSMQHQFIALLCHFGCSVWLQNRQVISKLDGHLPWSMWHSRNLYRVVIDLVFQHVYTDKCNSILVHNKKLSSAQVSFWFYRLGSSIHRCLVLY